MFVGTQLNIVHASKLSVWINYVRSLSTKEKYESCKSFNTLGNFHVYESFSIAPHLKLYDAFVKWITKDSIEFPSTRPIVPGTRPIVLGTLLEITWCIDLVALGWIRNHSDNYSRQYTSLGNFTCQALKGLLTRFNTRGTTPTGFREKEQGGPPWVGPLGQKTRATTWQNAATSIV
jgi:hypothetical protein